MTAVPLILFFESISQGDPDDERAAVDARFPVRGGLDILGIVRCYHGWKTRRTSKNSHNGCVGWVAQNKRNVVDGLDCGFFCKVGQGEYCIAVG